MGQEKVCYQIVSLPEPTPCFKMGGGMPCLGRGCLVEDVLDKTPFVYQDLIEQLCHSVCRNSLVSKNNQEFLERFYNPDGGISETRTTELEIVCGDLYLLGDTSLLVLSEEQTDPLSSGTSRCVSGLFRTNQ